MLAKKMSGALSVTPAATDSNFKDTVLLLHGDGTNGAQNNSFVDSSSNAFTVTRNNSATQGSFSPFSPTGWSNYFDGSSYLTGPTTNSAFNLGGGNWTIETWAYPTAFSNQMAVIVSLDNATGGYYAFGLLINTNGSVQVYQANSTPAYFINTTSSTGVVSLNTWNHIAAVRSGSNFAIFVNGTRVASESTVSGTQAENRTVNIGQDPYANNLRFSGYLSNLRVVKGTAVYDPTQTTLTVPTAALTAITNTSLLTCQSNRFRDSSTNDFTITRNGNPSVQAFSPFSPDAAYDAATHGGSAFFGNPLTSASLSMSPSGLSSMSVWTIECWGYNSSGIGDQVILGPWGPNLIRTAGSTLQVYLANSLQFNESGVWIQNQWNHLVVTNDGTTLRVYTNGVLRNTNSSVTINLSSMVIGSEVSGATTNDRWNGYISDFRVLNGTALYTGSTYTVPTAPLTAITNTAILLRFANAGIVDSTAKNVFQTVGNAQLDTGTKKFGTGALEFDGSGDWLFGPTNDARFGFGTGDFTIEFWAWKSANGSANYDGVITFYKSSTEYWYVELSTSQGFSIYNRSTANFVRNSTTTGINDSTWHHWAVCRSGGTWYLFKDGVSLTKNIDDIGSASLPTPTSIYVGNEYDGSNYAFNGFIDDLRVTRGVARYTANFTPPAKAFADQ